MSVSACASDEQPAVQTADEPAQGSVSVTFTPFEDPGTDPLADVVVATEPDMAPAVTSDDTLPAGIASPAAPADQPAPADDVDAYGNQLAPPHPNPELARSSRVQPLLTLLSDLHARGERTVVSPDQMAPATVRSMAIVCAGGDARANEYFGSQVFAPGEASSEDMTWIVYQRTDGQIVKEFHDAQVLDACHMIGDDYFDYGGFAALRGPGVGAELDRITDLDFDPYDEPGVTGGVGFSLSVIGSR